VGKDRANVLRSVARVLEANPDLVMALKHTVGAKTLSAGARIVGNGVTFKELPVPVMILDFDSSAPDSNDGISIWDVFVDVFAADVFEAANLLDLIDDAVSAYRMNTIPDIPRKLNEIRALNHQRIEPQPPEDLITVRVALRLKWA
jgi:hypothetical protein